MWRHLSKAVLGAVQTVSWPVSLRHNRITCCHNVGIYLHSVVSLTAAAAINSMTSKSPLITAGFHPTVMFIETSQALADDVVSCCGSWPGPCLQHHAPQPVFCSKHLRVKGIPKLETRVPKVRVWRHSLRPTWCNTIDVPKHYESR